MKQLLLKARVYVHMNALAKVSGVSYGHIQNILAGGSYSNKVEKKLLGGLDKIAAAMFALTSRLEVASAVVGEGEE